MNSYPVRTNVPDASPFKLVTSGCIGPLSNPDSTVPLPFNRTATSQLEGRSVRRCPKQLRLHPALEELGWLGLVDELNEATRNENQSVAKSVLVTPSGTILAGFGAWQLALLESRDEIHCIEYPLSETESLPFILTHHQPWRGWNAFVRIRLALTLTPYFQERALDNMRAGGKHKGSARLPEAQHIDVRQQIAAVAAVGARNVSNVKMILDRAHPRLKDALRDGTLTINRAIQLCKLPRSEQLEQFTYYVEDREVGKVIRGSIGRAQNTTTALDAIAVLDSLLQQAALQPESVVVRAGRQRGTVVLVGQDLLTAMHSQKKLQLT